MASLASSTVRDFTDGFLGLPSPSTIEENEAREREARLASDALISEINTILEQADADRSAQWNYSPPQRPIARYESGSAITNNAYAGSVSSRDQDLLATMGNRPTIGARNSIERSYGNSAASGNYTEGLGSTPQYEAAPPAILNRAGPGTYSDGNGDIYAQAGPHGVVNTRTGEFSPTN